MENLTQDSKNSKYDFSSLGALDSDGLFSLILSVMGSRDKRKDEVTS
jgi:hypothetical protein